MMEWTENEIGILMKEYPFNPTSEIASGLNRSVSSTRWKASDLQCKKCRKYFKSLFGYKELCENCEAWTDKLFGKKK